VSRVAIRGSILENFLVGNCGWTSWRRNSKWPDWPKKRNFEQGILKGEVSLYYWLPVWLVWNRMRTEIFCFYLQNRLIQTSQTGGQWYSDTSSFSILCFESLTSFFAWSLIKCLILNLKNIWKAKIDPVTASFLQKNDKNNFVSFFWSVSLNAIWMKLCSMSI